MADRHELVLTVSVKKAEEFALVVLPRSKPAYLIPKIGIHSTSIEIDGTLYAQTKAADWQGFYDWMRTTGGEVVGVRLWLDEDGDKRLLAIQCDGVEVDATRRLVQIWFTKLRQCDQSQSDDQDFGGNRLFRSFDGSLALTFNSPDSR